MEKIKTHSLTCLFFQTFQSKPLIKRVVIFFLLLMVFSACSPFRSRLDQLGRSHDYDDVSIPPNFYDFQESHSTNGNSESGSIKSHAQKVSGSVSQRSLETYDVTFKVENREFHLAYNKALRWNGCYLDQKARGGSGSDVHCGVAFLQGGFHENLNLAFFRCVQEASKAAGYPRPVRAFIRHWGTYSNRRVRNGKTLSLHARARAMDIVKFRLFDEKGTKYEVSTLRRHYRGNQAVFYDEFRDCWKNSLPGECTFSRRGEYLGSIGHPASRLGGDSLHNDHLHLSFPLCAGA